MLKSFRFILFPLSILYGIIIWVRNKLFDKNYIKSASFNFPIICVGNLAVGGTGKTPMAEYLIRLLKVDKKVAVISRGYKRKTKGFGIAGPQTTAIEIGDEPMQIHEKFPDITVAVAEERVVGVSQLLHELPDTGVIILDDAFQHREIRAGLNILLTDYNNLYTRDFLLPAGDLRDLRSSSQRAQIIVVTKCKPYLSEVERQKIISEIRPLPYQKVFFTKIKYSVPYHLFTKEELILDIKSEVLLVCGIANPSSIKEVLNKYVASYEILSYPDHHIFDTDNLKEINRQFDRIKNPHKIILTTEKDGVRLMKFRKSLESLPIYVFPMRHSFLFGEKEVFDNKVENFVHQFQSI